MSRQFRQGMPMCSTLLLISVTISMVFLPIAVSAEAPGSLPDDEALLKMKVKDLKAILQKKGPDAACVACTSKQEYVSRIHETIDWADVTPEPEPTPMGDEPTLEELQKMFSSSENDERIAGLKKQLEEAGIDPSQIFAATGFNRDEILKETEKFEKKKGNADSEEGDAEEEDADSSEGGDYEAKSDL